MPERETRAPRAQRSEPRRSEAGAASARSGRAPRGAGATPRARRTPPEAEPALLPYARQCLAETDVQAVCEALRAERLAQGPLARRFEAALAGALGTAHAVAVSSGTAALHSALLALDVGPGDEVLVPPLTFVATVNAVLLCGATPIFVDVEPKTLALDPQLAARRAGPLVRGAIAVHLGGHPADMRGLRDALGPDRFLLEDACHALGATLDGRSAGALGDAACFSFHPAKAITTGEGGAVTTSDTELCERLQLAREHGIERRAERFQGLGLPEALAAEESGGWVYEQHELAPNYRLSEPAAALGLSQLARLPELLARRRALAQRYTSALCDLDTLECPSERQGAASAWHLYQVRLRHEALRGGRAALFAALRARGIGVQVHYIPVHLQPYHRHLLGTRWGDLPVAEAAYLRLLSLPLFPALRDSDVDRVVDVLRAELRRARR